MNKKTIEDIDVYNKKVLLRVDFNVPIKDGVITDDNRIVEELPTIKYLLDSGAAVIIISHLGRPDGKVDLKYSLKPIVSKLNEYLQKEVLFAEDCIGKEAVNMAKSLNSGEVLLLENLRFYKEEEENEKAFCEKLASLADIYVNDAFGVAHRKHASTYGIAKLMPNAIGFLIEKELKMIVGTIKNPKSPFVAVLGGAKVGDKLIIVESLIEKVDTIIIGGGMAYTYLLAKDFMVGDSLIEPKMLAEAKRILEVAEKKGVDILLPIDHVIADDFDNPTLIKTTKSPNVPENFVGMDIGEATIKLFAKTIKKAKSIIMNGPMGVFENKNFQNGTKQIIKVIAKNRGTTIIGGGDSVSAVNNFGFAKKITHISTGGGASLKLFEGKVLPGVDVIESN